MTGYVQDLRKFIGTRPLIVVGSAVIVMNDCKEILLQHRSDTKEWGLPGGAMEPGETLEETAARELFEETGLNAASFTFKDVLSGKPLYFKYPNGDEVYNVIHVFLAEGIYGDLSMMDGESLALGYFPLQALPAELDDRARMIIEKHL